MPNYFVTGKLGGGKSKLSVKKISDYLNDGRQVATNLDIFPQHILGKDKKETKLYRLPDHPTKRDLELLGKGYEGQHDENKTGLIVLDECGTWLNAREWADKSRRPLLDYLLHIRKQRWDVIFIVQDISLIDKQFRKALAENVVYCRRTDRIPIPFLSTILKLFGFDTLTFVKGHVGIVKYGDLPNSLTVDKWWHFGNSLNSAYDTEQVFSPSDDQATYLQLPTHYIYRNSIAKRNLRFYMRLTKIVARKYSRVLSFFAGGIFLILINYMMPVAQATVSKPVEKIANNGKTQIANLERSDPVISLIGSLYLTGSFGGNGYDYFFEDVNGFGYQGDDLYARGISIGYVNACFAKLNYLGREYNVYCKPTKIEQTDYTDMQIATLATQEAMKPQ